VLQKSAENRKRLNMKLPEKYVGNKFK